MQSLASQSTTATIDVKPAAQRITLGMPMGRPWVWRAAAMFLIAVGLSWGAFVALNTTETISGWPVADVQAWESQVRTARADMSFIGAPVMGSKVAFVFVGDDGGSPDLRATAQLANSLCQSTSLGNVQFGFIQTSDDTGGGGELAALLNKAEPIPIVTSGLQPRDEKKHVNAAQAFAAVRAWQPDQIIVVLTEPIQDRYFSQARAEVMAWNVQVDFFATASMLDVDLMEYGDELGKIIMPTRPELLADLKDQSGNVR